MTDESAFPTSSLQFPEFSRRSFLGAAGSAALGAGVMATAPRAWANAPADEVVRIGYLPITDATALLVAHGMGFFKEEGLEVADPTLMRGWSPLVEGFAAHKFNLVHLLKPIPVWMRYNNNFPVKIMAWAHTNGSGLVVGKDSGINAFSDMGGKQVAVPFWYSMHNVVLQLALRDAGLKAVIKPEGVPLEADEVNLQVLPPPDMPPALAARKVDAYIVAEPFNAMGELRAGGRMLRFTGDIWKNHPCCVICMHEADTVDPKRAAWTQAVMNAVVKAQIYASENKAEVARMMSRDGKNYMPMPAEVVERAMTLYDEASYSEPRAIKHPEWQNGRIDFQPWPYPSATRMIVEAMNNTVVGGDTTFLNGLDPQVVADDLVNYTFVKAALDKYPEWMNDPSVNPGDPFTREEVVRV